MHTTGPDRRFSREVVASMDRVLRQEQKSGGYRQLILIGHSGGGALAVLLAHETRGVSGVVTLGGNLDTDAWAQRHRYAPLTGSENPALRGTLPMGVTVIHLVGSKDRVVTPILIGEAATKIGGRVIVYEGFTHACCWEKIWPAPLAMLHAPPTPTGVR